MNDKEKKAIKDEISRQINEIKKNIKELEELTKPIAPDVAIGRLTRMEAINEKSINESSLRNARDTLLKLEQALARVESPDFGICSICKKEIPRARILRIPETTRCVNCTSK